MLFKTKFKLFLTFAVLIAGAWLFFSGGSGDNGSEESISGEAILDVEEEDSFIVTKVIDGDTIVIDSGDAVRLICIDAPEHYEKGYANSKKYLEDILLGKQVKLEKDVSDRDKYHRLLRYVYIDRVFVNELIVEQGHAKSYSYHPDISLCPEIGIAEEKAKKKELGIWGEILETPIYEGEDEDNSIEEPLIENSEDEVLEEDPKDLPTEIVCDINFYNCGDFSTCEEVTKVFDFCEKDIHYLDADEDGVPCETLCG